MTDNWFNKFTIRKFNQILYNPHISKESAFFKLKTSFDFNEKCLIVDQLPTNFETFIYGKALPSDIKELVTVDYQIESTSIEDEINWFLLSVRKYKEKLNDFIVQKQNYDNCIILGDLDQAEGILNYIDTNICLSLWSIENRLLLKEIIGGIDENKILLSKYIEEIGGHFIIHLADFYSKKAENDMMINRYNVDFKNFITNLPELNKFETIEYYYFKANYFELCEYKFDNVINAVEFRNSLIDRYLSFLKIFYNKINNHSITEEEFNKFKSRINYLSRKVSDPLVYRLYTFFHEDEAIILKDVDKQALEIFDTYASDNYDETIPLISKFLSNNPDSYEFYIIYAKCIINQRIPFKALNGKDNFQNKILFDTYEILRKKNNPALHLQALRKISYQLSSMNIANQIIDFVSQETSNSSKFERISYLNSKFINPIFSKIYKNKSSAKAFLQSIDSQYPYESETIKFIFHHINNTLEEAIDDLKMSDDKKRLYTAKHHIENKNYKDAISLLVPLLGVFNDIPHTYQTIISSLYHSYWGNGDLSNCIKLFVDAYFENQNYIIKLNTTEIIEKIRENKFRNLNIDINLPIFFKLSNSLETRTTIACERFLANWNIKKPSEFIEILRTKDNANLTLDEREKQIYFLDKICTLDLFKHMVSIKGTKEKLNERLSITRFLLEYDSNNQKEHQEEIEELNRQILIQDGLQEYDESKIFINEKQIRNLLLKEVETEFHRFKNISKIIKENPLLILIDSSTKQIQSLSIKGKEKNKDQLSYSTDPIFDLIKGMFFEIRDLFIDSDYGLREYLSARIRHGVYKSEIRPKFDKLKLLTEKDSISNNYQINQYWSKKLEHLPKEIQDNIQKALSDFSKKIDNLIEEEALKKYLHIKTENKNKDGWFNFEFDDSQLTIYSLILRECETFQQFIDECFTILWQRTDENLEFIRQKFSGEVKDEYEKAISELEMGLLDIVHKNTIPELFENLTTSKVNIQNDMDRIARWFNRVGKQTKEFSINKIIEISTTNANKGYGNRRIKLIKNINCDFLFKGELYPSFVDIMYSFFKNTLEYCGLESGEVDTYLDIKLDQQKLILNISNKLYGDIDESIKRFNAFQIETSRSADDSRSGLKKALRIIKSDFGDKSNSLLYNISKEEKSFNVTCVINIDKLKYENPNN